MFLLYKEGVFLLFQTVMEGKQSINTKLVYSFTLHRAMYVDNVVMTCILVE